jgi:RNA polymerase sigma-70 factor (ECF subfamily)
MEQTHLINMARQGDLQAFNQIVLHYQDALYEHVWWIVKDHEQAQDITQEAFIKAFRRLGQFRGGAFKSWLLRIATNTALDELRSQQRHPGLSLDSRAEADEEYEMHDWLSDPGPGVEAQVEQQELRVAIAQALASLPVEYRLAVTLVDVQELPYAEAAQVMQVSIGTVKSRVARGRAALKVKLATAGGSPPRPGGSVVAALPW